MKKNFQEFSIFDYIHCFYQADLRLRSLASVNQSSTNNVPNVISQVESRENRMYTNLTPNFVALWCKEVIFDRPSGQNNSHQSMIERKMNKQRNNKINRTNETIGTIGISET